jgi:hypothetical protein
MAAIDDADELQTIRTYLGDDLTELEADGGRYGDHDPRQRTRQTELKVRIAACEARIQEIQGTSPANSPSFP